MNSFNRSATPSVFRTLFVCLLFIPCFYSFGNAQTADIKIKDIPADEMTTIEINKKTKVDAKMEYQITEGQEEIAGDPAPLIKDARLNWKKACTEWKNETKELNKGNQVITLSCGSMKCTTTAMETTCNSTGVHKIKIKL